MTVVNMFEYKAKKLSEYELIKEALELLDDIKILVRQDGKMVGGGIGTLADPDGTFSILMCPKYTRVTLTEGESEHEVVYLVREAPQQCVVYNPGPWATRIRLLLGKSEE